MPLYTYQCESCGNRQQHIRGEKKRKRPAKCLKCGKKAKYSMIGNWFLPNPSIASKGPVATREDRQTPRPRAGRSYMRDVTIVGGEVAMLLNGVNVDMERVRISKAKRGIIANNSKIDLKDIDIS